MALPTQSRREWVAEFSALLAEARRRGDTRPGPKIIGEWFKFRSEQSTSEHVGTNE